MTCTRKGQVRSSNELVGVLPAGGELCGEFLNPIQGSLHLAAGLRLESNQLFALGLHVTYVHANVYIIKMS